MSMLSTLDALEATESSAAVPRAGVFQPKVKARVRKGGGREDGGAGAAGKLPAAARVAAKTSPAVPAAITSDALDLSQSAVEETEISQTSIEADDARLSKERDSAPGPSILTGDLTKEVPGTFPPAECAPSDVAKLASPERSRALSPARKNAAPPAAEADSVVTERTVLAAAQEIGNSYTQESSVTTQESTQPVATRSRFPVPSASPSTENGDSVQEDAVPVSDEPSNKPPGNKEVEPTSEEESATPGKLKRSARKSRKISSTPAASATHGPSSEEAVDDDLEETLVTLDDELIANLAMREEHAGMSGRKRKRAFPHSTSRPKGQREDVAEWTKVSRANRSNCDLSNPSILPLREVIRRAENIERKKAKEEMAKKSLLDTPKPKGREAVRERTPPRDVLSLAPQVQVINGRIVVNEQSLTVGAYATTAQDLDQYTRVEEKSSRLNYASYTNRTVTERWKQEDTDLFYKAIRQFGTDFDLIKNLFPTRTRRQIKAKYKKEETVNPRRVSDALTYRPKDQAHYQEMLSRMKMDDLIQDNSDPFASILAYTVKRADDKAGSEENAETQVADTETEEEILASIGQ